MRSRLFCIVPLFALAACDRGAVDPADREFPILAVGDIADCANGNTSHTATAALVDQFEGPVLALGDLAYENGTALEFSSCYQPSWGRHKARTFPVPGNHEYNTPGATGYFEYFGARAGDPTKGYYSFEVGQWLLLALNSNIAIDAGSPQELWVREQIASTRRACTLAYMHHPRFSSSVRGNDARLSAIWRTLATLGADVVLAGHDHIYERFTRLDADGRIDPVNGIASFIAGTGGRSLHALGTVAAGSERRSNTDYGVLRMTLRGGDYGWAFVTTGGEIRDTGQASCR